MDSKQPISKVFDLSGKCALVTGGAMGIGEAIVRRLAEARAKVMISDIDAQAGQKVAQDINQSGGTAGAFFHAQLAAKHMVEQKKQGKIINIASIDAFHPYGNLVEYDTSKGGMVMMTKSMAAELGRHGINVNAIVPGAIATPGATGGSSSIELSKEQLDAVMSSFIARIPVGHMGDPDDIALTTLFLASDASNYILGATLVVDGGYLLS